LKIIALVIAHLTTQAVCDRITNYFYVASLLNQIFVKATSNKLLLLTSYMTGKPFIVSEKKEEYLKVCVHMRHSLLPS